MRDQYVLPPEPPPPRPRTLAEIRRLELEWPPAGLPIPGPDDPICQADRLRHR